MKRVAVLAAVMLALAACSGGEPTFVRDDLERLVLPPELAPARTTFVDGDSGFTTLERLAEDEEEAAALEEAGFEAAYVNIFLDPKLFDEQDFDPSGSVAISFAMLFDSPEGATEGLRVIEADVRADSPGVEDRPTPGLGEDAFAVHGVLDPSEPPGFLFAWRVGNVVQILVAAGAEGRIDENAARVLVDRVRAQALA